MGREGEWGDKKYQLAAFHTYPYQDRTHNPRMWPDQKSNPWPSSLWDDAQSGHLGQDPSEYFYYLYFIHREMGSERSGTAREGTH